MESIADSFKVKYPHLVQPNLKTFNRDYNEVKIKSFVHDGQIVR